MLGQTLGGAGQIIDAARQNVRCPRKRRPVGKAVQPAEGHVQRIAHAALALSHHERQPVETVQFYSKAAIGCRLIPYSARIVGLEAEAHQGQLTTQQRARGFLGDGA